MPSSTTYSTPGAYTFTLPANIDLTTALTVTLNGAGGGRGAGAAGGAGAKVVGTISLAGLTPGVSAFGIQVGGKGSDYASDSPPNGGAGGYPNGGTGGSIGGVLHGAGGGGGGGRSAIKSGATYLAVAGAGGGGGGCGTGGSATGGAGGFATAPVGQTGGAGSLGTISSRGAGGGGGNTTLGTGGVAGASGAGASNTATAGASLSGGNGSNHGTEYFKAGGGGGDGWWGGGGGGGAPADGGASGPENNGAGGGGGGSNYAGGLTSTSTNGTGGAAAGNDGSVLLSYNLVPNQPSLIAHANGDDTAGVQVGWVFSDPDASDTQSKADVRWRIGAGAWTTISPAVTGAGATYTFAANTFQTAGVIGQSVEWQVRTYDAAAAVGPWSTSGFVVPRREPTTTPTITVPAVNGPSVPVTVANTTQFRYARVTMTDVTAGTTVDFGWLDAGSEVTSWAFTLASYAYVNGQQYKFRVFTGDYLDVPVPSPVSTPDVTVTAVLNSSLQPTCTVTPNTTSGAVQVNATNPGSDPNAPTRNEVWRTDLDHGGAETRIASTVAVNGSFTDWQAPTNTNLRYRIAAIAPNGNRTYSA